MKQPKKGKISGPPPGKVETQLIKLINRQYISELQHLLALTRGQVNMQHQLRMDLRSAIEGVLDKLDECELTPNLALSHFKRLRKLCRRALECDDGKGKHAKT